MLSVKDENAVLRVLRILVFPYIILSITKKGEHILQKSCNVSRGKIMVLDIKYKSKNQKAKGETAFWALAALSLNCI